MFDKKNVTISDTMKVKLFTYFHRPLLRIERGDSLCQQRKKGSAKKKAPAKKKMATKKKATAKKKH